MRAVVCTVAKVSVERVASELPGAMSRCGVYVYAQEKRYRRQTLPELTRLLKLSGDEILPVNDA